MDAGYLTLEPLLMQIELEEMRFDDDFLENELGISNREARRDLLFELFRGNRNFTETACN